MPRKRQAASSARLIALNSICATACSSAARPSGVPRPRVGTSRGATSAGLSGRPATHSSEGAGASARTDSAPERSPSWISIARAAFASGSRSSSASRSAAYRQSGIIAARPRSGRSAALELGLVAALALQAFQVTRLQAGDVLAVEAGRIEARELFLGTGDGVLEVGQVLVDQP